MSPLSDAPRVEGMPAEVSRSLESVWARHAGASPQAVETVIMADTVICKISGGTVEFSEGMIAPRGSLSEGSEAAPEKPTYKSEALAAVEEVTGRHVKFFTSRSDSAADVATEIFTLEGG